MPTRSTPAAPVLTLALLACQEPVAGRRPAPAELPLAEQALVPGTTARRVAQVLFPVPAGASRRIDVRLAPTIARPLAEKLCG